MDDNETIKLYKKLESSYINIINKLLAKGPVGLHHTIKQEVENIDKFKNDNAL
jgi:hypothetical protein